MGVERQRSIDVLRGTAFVGMSLVGAPTSSVDRPNWLKHAAPNQSVTFADTIFPCFLFTSGLTAARSRRPQLASTARRVAILGLAGILSNVARRFTAPSTLLNINTYRLPSVLGRIGLASAVASLDPLLPSGVLPVSLASAWYLVQGLFSGQSAFTNVSLSADSRLDSFVFGRSHLHNPMTGFDPEGLLGSLFTAPLSILAGTYYQRWRQGNLVLEMPQLGLAVIPFAAHFWHAYLSPTGAAPVSKIFWTPPYVLTTTIGCVLVYESVDFLIRTLDRQLPVAPVDEQGRQDGKPWSSMLNKVFDTFLSKLQVLGQYSFECYMLSAFAPNLLRTPLFGYPPVWEVLKWGMVRYLGVSSSTAGVAVSVGFVALLAEVAPVLGQYGRVLR